MIPTIQFDPSSLSIWTTVGTLSGEMADRIAAVLAAAAIGEDVLPAVADLSEADPRRRHALWLASSVWHEKRHFFDTCMTNYGARRFRDLFNITANFWPLAAAAKSAQAPVWFPVETYGCPVRRRILGISEPAANIAEVARRARQMKRLANTLDSPVMHASGVLHVGGEAQMEGLAQASQVHAIEYQFGFGEVSAVTREYIRRLPLDGPYRTIEAIAGGLGCIKDISQDTAVVNVGLASALFITALCGRFFGGGALVEEDLVLPSTRLARLISALGPSPGHFEMPDGEAWELVDNAARRLWGRTALEEIAADIEAMDAARAGGILSQPYLIEEQLPDAWADFVALRQRLFAAVQKIGPASLLPRAFPEIWLDRLLPWHIVATPGGESGEDARSTVVLAQLFNQPPGLEDIVPQRAVWARLHEPPADRAAAGFALSDRGAWLQMLERHGPRARLMLNGRRHRLMVPPELERQVDELTEIGIKVQFDGPFEWPEERDPKTRTAEALALADWSGRDTMICDITGNEIAAADAAVLTPWEFRRLPHLVQAFRNAHGPAEFMADVQLAADWSDWVVRSDLLPS